MPASPTGVLLMAYGSPDSAEDIEPYYTDIRGGRKPSPELLAQLTARYARIGGRTPLLEITRQQARALQEELGEGYRTHTGMKHWRPYIAQAVAEMQSEGVEHAVGLVLAPHYSRFSIDGYIERAQDAMQKCGAHFDIRYVKSWNVEPLFVRSIAERLQTTREEFGLDGWDGIQVIFTAHSLPERILASNDPYPGELLETCEAVAAETSLPHDNWRLAYQSAGRTGEKWLGPDVLAVLDELAAARQRRIIIAPIGFVTDHLEILYDVDVECADRARELGLELRRTPSANATPTFIRALAAVVHSEAESSPSSG